MKIEMIKYIFQLPNQHRILLDTREQVEEFMTRYDTDFDTELSKGKLKLAKYKTEDHLFSPEAYQFKKPPIQVSNKFINSIDDSNLPVLYFDDMGDIIKENHPEDYSGATSILGCFIELRDSFEVSAAFITLAFSDKDCYSPIGQHSTYHRNWLDRVWIISLEDYKAISGNLYTPEGYIKGLESINPYEVVHDYAIKDLAFPEQKVKEVYSV